MDEICRRIQIISVDRCLPHEGIKQELVGQIASHIQNDGILKNPIVVTPYQGCFVILDGMHRFAAIRQLNIPAILIFEVDYFSEGVVLEPPFAKKEILERAVSRNIFPPKSTRHLVSGRPLRIDLDLALLRSDQDLRSKNKILQDRLRRCYENNRVRFYSESVTVFSD